MSSEWCTGWGVLSPGSAGVKMPPLPFEAYLLRVADYLLSLSTNYSMELCRWIIELFLPSVFTARPPS